MYLKHLDKTIIAAVAQRPFVTGDNTFCKLIPLFDYHDRVDGILSENEFYNDGEIWWKVSSQFYPEQILPGMLVETRLDRATGANYDMSDASLYEARFDASEIGLGSKNGAEVFQLSNETENSLSRFKGVGDRISLPHKPSRLVFFQVAGSVFGPFSTERSTMEAEGCRVTVTAKPVLDGLKIFKIDWEQFNRLYQPFSAVKDVSLNQTKRHASVNRATVSWTYLPAAVCERMQNDFLMHWQEMDFDPLSTKLGKILRSLEGFTRADRKNARHLVERLEKAVTSAEDPDKVRGAVAGIETMVESVDQTIREIAKVLMENGLLNAEKLKESEQAYLNQWIETQSAQITKAIEAKRHELDQLTQQVAEDKSRFELEAKRREKEFNDKMEKELSDLDNMKQEEMARIASERENWTEERRRLTSEFAEKEARISEMLAAIKGASEKQAEEIIGIYPFLERIGVGRQAEVKSSESTPKVMESEVFQIPAILKNGCKGATVAIDQTIFLRQLDLRAQAHGFFFDPADLRRFHTSVLCEGLTILAGPSGVGKSSLARIYGEVLSGGEEAPRNGTHVIHVNPTWMERADVLGYVNTVTGEFSPSETGLFQRLIYAAEDDRTNGGDAAVYPICLDEMNLSQIEHYFNDFMQLLEQPDESRILPCFSPEAVKRGSMFSKYASIRLAPSLRFIGTVNFDETTRRMSMRLLDRVNLVHISDATPARLPNSINETDTVRGISYATYSSWIKKESLPSAVEKCLQALDPHLRILGAAVSPRVKEGMKKYIASSKPLIEDSNPEWIAFDEQVAQRVLSKIRGLSSDTQEVALRDVEQILDESCGAPMTQSRRMINALRGQGRPFGFQGEDED